MSKAYHLRVRQVRYESSVRTRELKYRNSITNVFACCLSHQAVFQNTFLAECISQELPKE
jgi:hypothetical protein